MTLQDLQNISPIIDFYEDLGIDETDGNSYSSYDHVHTTRTVSIKRELATFAESHTAYIDSKVIFRVHNDQYIYILLLGNGEHDANLNNTEVQKLFIRYLNCLQKSDQSKIDLECLCTVKQLVDASNNIDIMRDIGFELQYQQQRLKQGLLNSNVDNQADASKQQTTLIDEGVHEEGVHEEGVHEEGVVFSSRLGHECNIS